MNKTVILHGNFIATLVVEEPGTGLSKHKLKPIKRRATVQMLPNGGVRVFRSSLIWSNAEIAKALAPYGR